MSETNHLEALAEDAPLLQSHAVKDQGHVDIVAMIDLVFMLNIYFMVTSLAVAMATLDLPPAHAGVLADADHSVMFTLMPGDSPDAPAQVFEGEKAEGSPYPNGPELEDMVRSAVEKGQGEGKNNVIIRAERNVLHKDVSRVAAAAAEVEGAEFYVAVISAD